MRSPSDQVEVKMKASGRPLRAGAGQDGRQLRGRLCWPTLAGCALLLALAGLSEPTSAAPAEETSPASVWLTDFGEASRQSRHLSKPLLVRSEMKACPYCRLFSQTLTAPQVSERLENFILFRLDLDLDPRVALELDVHVAPAVLLFAPNGMQVARADGYLPPADFLKWLEQAEEKVRLLRPEVLYEDPVELVKLLSSRDPVLREAATDALVSQTEAGISPATTAAVVEGFVTGNLALRLGTLELLRSWGAPVEGADPWKPDTIAAAVERLRQWAGTVKLRPASLKPSPEEIEQDLQLWMTAADGPRTRAVYERLARVGGELLPRVRELIPPTWDLSRERLGALRYRLLMPSRLAFRLSQVPFQMAARDPKLRVQALDAVSRSVRIEGEGAKLQEFFVEAFADPDARVREAALRGLRETGAGLAKKHVLRLLADPSPNVRAGVLNDLAQSPLPDVAAELAEYAFNEEDEDLVVHATRALREIRNRAAAFEALSRLIEHRSWRVRAEAVEALGGVSTRSRDLASFTRSQSAALAKMLERALQDQDTFVVAKAIEVVKDLDTTDVSNCLDELVTASEKDPELTLLALEAMAGNSSLKKKAVTPIKKLCQHQKPEVRAAALRTLVTCTRAPMKNEILAGLADADPTVRAAAATSIWLWVEEARWEVPSESVSLVSRLRSILGSKPRTAPAVMPTETQQEFVSALRKQASAQDAKERFAALQALAVLGDTEVAFPGIEEMVAGDASLGKDAVRIVPLLDWEKRKKMFETLSQQPLREDTWAGLFSSVFHEAPREAEELLWQVFENDPHVLVCPDEVTGTVFEFYGFERYSWEYGDKPSAATTAKLAERARAQLASANVRRQVLGLVMLCRASQGDGEAEAKRIVETPPGAPEVRVELRRAAGEILLCIEGGKYEPFTLEALSSEDDYLRKAALKALLSKYTTVRCDKVVHVGDKPVWVQFFEQDSYRYYEPSRSSRKVWSPPKLPEGLGAAVLRPFLETDDPELLLGASHLLVLLGDTDALDNLLEAWRVDPDDEDVRLLLVRAIAAVGHDRNVKYLREIYGSLDPDDKDSWGPTLYWTMRRMEGAEAAELRGTIRTELGVKLMR
jgi:HEAT repeat protein/thioredoxin-related protein